MGLRPLAKNLSVLFLRGLLGFLMVTLMVVVSLRWIDPSISSFMLQHRVSAWIDGHERPYLHQEWTNWEAIPPEVRLAAVAAEDQRFPDHRGFDLVEIAEAWGSFRDSGRLRGASTISQQVAKNLFLWRDKSLVRKGLEVWFTVLIELAWPKRRILEVYLNIAQFGPDTYGVGAASWRYFERPAVALRVREAALLAAVLPNPDRYRLDAPSQQVTRRAAWVRKQMKQLGTGYLKGI